MTGDLVTLLRSRAETMQDRLSFRFLQDAGADQTLTYAELDRRARGIGARLAAEVTPGSRVLLMYPPGLDFIAAFFGCLYAGAVAVPVYPPDAHRLKWTLPRLLSVVGDCGAVAVVTAGAVATMRDQLEALAPELARLRWVTTDDAESAASDWKAPAGGGDTLAFLQYTSGSTSAPKGVMLTHANIIANQRVIHAGMGQSADSVCGGWLPPYHDMGLIGLVLHSVYLGMPCVLMSPVHFLQQPRRWLQAISDHRITISGGPNFGYDMCVKKTTEEQRAALDLGSWQVAFTGAEAVRPATLRAFADAFAVSGFKPEAFYPCYGLAEATLMVTGGARDERPIVRTFDRAELQKAKARRIEAGGPAGQEAVSCGIAPEGYDVRIVDPELLTPCADLSVGEIRFRGPSVASGYWGRDEETTRTFGARTASGEGPFLRTGDLGFLDGGELFVTGRLKELIVVRGRKLYPQDIEQTAEKCQATFRTGSAAVFDVPGQGEEHVVLVQEIARVHLKEPEALLGGLKQLIAEEHQVQLGAVSFVRPGTIPKTSSGKLQRRALREAFRAGTVESFFEWRTKALARPAETREP